MRKVLQMFDMTSNVHKSRVFYILITVFAIVIYGAIYVISNSDSKFEIQPGEFVNFIVSVKITGRKEGEFQNINVFKQFHTF